MMKEGYNGIDAADIYGPAELIVGEALNQWNKEPEQFRNTKLAPVSFTKYVPRLDLNISKTTIKNAIENSCNRMKVNCIDLLQFHWWDYDDLRWKNVIQTLASFCSNQDGSKQLIRVLGLTNFDTIRWRIMIEDMKLPIATNQVSFSIIDQRPKQKGMIQFCKTHGLSLMCYGTLLGGFLSDNYLGKPLPTGSDLNTSSKKKYIRFIKQWATWDLFQELLQVLHLIAVRHGSGYNISIVSQRFILDQECVAGILIGARLSISDHMEENKKVFELKLTPEDFDEIEKVVAKGNMLPGDCGDEYRYAI